MYALSPLQGYCDKRDINGRCDSSVGPDLDSAFDAGLKPDKSAKAVREQPLRLHSPRSQRCQDIRPRNLCLADLTPAQMRSSS